MATRRSVEVPRFVRGFFSSGQAFSRIGEGEIGGKAHGLVEGRRTVEKLVSGGRFADFEVRIPAMAVLGTEVFATFLARNAEAGEAAASDLADERVAHAFQRGDLPVEVVGDLKALVDEVHAPLAVRSSSLLEDALGRPFAGVYETKMIPFSQPDPNARFRQLTEAIKFVWASTFFAAARAYRRAAGRAEGEERMAVILQEVVGHRHDQRFYPHLSGVCRSYNFYPLGSARPEDGTVSLALGLGKTIVDGGICWSYSPARPNVPPPFGSVRERIRRSQTEFWAIHMGRPREHSPLTEAEHLVRAGLADADYDGTLDLLASTYDPATERLVPGTFRPGARVIDFAPLLEYGELPLNDLLRALLGACEDDLGGPVEIEFAASFERGPHGRFGFLQVRPMVVFEERVEIGEEELDRPGVLVASDRVMGNGVDETLADVVYLKPACFDAGRTPAIAAEVKERNAALVASGRPCLLIGFGRWGSRDPWLGVPVDWGHISQARAIVEATLPALCADPSQGSHFFHNITSFRVSYFWVHHERHRPIDWAWLDGQEAVAESAHVRHVRLDRPLLVKVDGRSARGGVWRPA